MAHSNFTHMACIMLSNFDMAFERHFGDDFWTFPILTRIVDKAFYEAYVRKEQDPNFNACVHDCETYPTRELFGREACDFISGDEREEAFLELIGYLNTREYAVSPLNDEVGVSCLQVDGGKKDLADELKQYRTRYERWIYIIQAAYSSMWMSWQKPRCMWLYWQIHRYSNMYLTFLLKDSGVDICQSSERALTQKTCIIRGAPIRLENQAATTIVRALSCEKDVKRLCLPENVKTELVKGVYALQYT